MEGQEQDRGARATEAIGGRLERLEALVADQRALIDAQAQAIEALRGSRRDTSGSRSAGPTTGPDSDPRDESEGDQPKGDQEPRSRRDLMRHGAAAVAGAAIAGAALDLASATPAAAASGTFDGNPAVSATANPSFGTGVKATTVTGSAMWGDATGTIGFSAGVLGSTSTDAGIGVSGQSGSPTGDTQGVKGEASSTGGTGVLGVATAATGSTFGVRGTIASTSGVGVEGLASAATGSGIGVNGTAASPDGVGVWGQASTGVVGAGIGATGLGVDAVGEVLGLRTASPITQLKLGGTPAPPLTVNRLRELGEIVFDSNHDLWVCVTAGNPGTWRRLTGPSSAGSLVPLPAPVRVYDSRTGFPPATGPKTKLVPNTPRPVDCTNNSSGVPIGATAVLVNLVATDTAAAGFMTIYKSGILWPGTSNLNFAANDTVGVTTFTALNAAAKVDVRANVACNVVVDILGYYQ